MSGLKDTINRNISDNTSGDITAEIMRETLNLIADYAEKGYKYGGIVSPQDKPVLPGDIPSVYIARYKGTYVNFGGIEIYQDGLYLFMNNGNGRYYLITLYALKDELGNDAYALLSQKTITRVLNNLEINISNSLSNIDKKLAIKSDKTSVIVSQASDYVTLYADQRNIVELVGDVTFTLYATHDTYAHSYEVDLNVGDTAYSVAFPAEIIWIKDLEIVANSRYMIVIDYNGVAYTAMYVVTGG